VLFPLLLSAAQWSAALPALTDHFTIILLSGPYLGGVAVLEDRARSASYVGMVRTVFHLLAPQPGETILDVGAGSGAVARIAAQSFGPSNKIVGVDLNAYLLREAGDLARQEGLADRLRFEVGNAEKLPFAENSVDHAYSVTVLEECDADVALSEMRRVVKPGGRVGVIVRAIDIAHPWHLDLPDELQRKVDDAPALVGPRGVADHTIYRRMNAGGFTHLTCFPMLASFNRAGGPHWSYLESRVLARLTATETQFFHKAAEAERKTGTLFVTSPHHCVVGTKPA
ncbi:MAG: methyltransferase domain-containing protein, partial [Xanthobacteraceae bacterium]